MKDYKKFYHLEAYLFSEIKNNFHERGFLTVEEFFCIIIWKSNRSKGKIKKTIRRLNNNIHEAIKKITSELYSKSSSRERLQYLLSKSVRLRLPIATALLTVLYPEYFTIYDYRVCNALKRFHNLANKINFERIWNSYLEFKNAVIKATPRQLSLRDKDRWLWGKSFWDDLNRFINE